MDRSGFSSSEKVSNFYFLSTANIINVGKTLKFSLVYWEENKEAILTASIDYWTEVPKQCTNAGKSSKKREKIGKKKQKFYYFLVDIIKCKEREPKRYYSKIICIKKIF